MEKLTNGQLQLLGQIVRDAFEKTDSFDVASKLTLIAEKLELEKHSDMLNDLSVSNFKEF